MRIRLSAALLTAPLLALSSLASAQVAPIGQWTTIDDKSKKAKSVVEIYEAKDGSLSAKVVDVLSSERGPGPVCDKCTGANKGKPIEGMVIMWGVRKAGNGWDGGKILDPASGKIYSVKVQPVAGGQKLEVRGFMGFSMLGRTQVWARR